MFIAIHFCIDPAGKLAAIYRRVKPAAHIAQVLADITRLQQDERQTYGE